MRLIENLGLRYATTSSKRRFLYGLYECPICLKHFISQINSVNMGLSTKCRPCSDQLSSNIKALKAASTFSADSSTIHKGIYTYELVVYINNRIKVAITCKVHGTFWQTPHSHRNGDGCPSCASYGFDPTKNATLYYLKVTDDTAVTYKIGITNRTIQERFTSTDLEKIQVLGSWEFRVGSDAYKEEQTILSQYREYKYIGIPILSSGNTELFTFDILGLDLV